MQLKRFDIDRDKYAVSRWIWGENAAAGVLGGVTVTAVAHMLVVSTLRMVQYSKGMSNVSSYELYFNIEQPINKSQPQFQPKDRVTLLHDSQSGDAQMPDVSYGGKAYQLEDSIMGCWI